VTTFAVSIPVLEGNIQHSGWGYRCSCVRASGVPVLTLESDPRVAEEIVHAEEVDGVGAVILCGAGMSRHLDALAARVGRKVCPVAPVAAATRLALAAASSSQ
jgi:allantoin racemase